MQESIRSPTPIRVVDGRAENLLSVRTVAARLGVSTATVYKLCAAGELVHVRISNALRVAPADQAAFIAHRRGVSYLGQK